MEEIINKLRECENDQLSDFRVEKEKIYSMQEGYQLAMERARNVVCEHFKEE